MGQRHSVDSQPLDQEHSHSIPSNSERSPLLLPQSDRPAHEQPAAESRNPHPFTRRAICLSLFLGIAGSAMNTYYGLRTGSVTGYSIPFAFIAKFVCISLTNSESAAVIAVAVTMATMPMVVANLGVIPALQFLTGPSEGGPVVLTTFRHILWAQGISFFALFFAMLLRDQFLCQEDLPFPSAIATATTIDKKATQAALSKSCTQSNDGGSVASERYPNRPENVPDNRVPQGNVEGSRVMTFFILVALSGVYTLATRLIPDADLVHCIPLRAKDCWYLDISPGVIGLGMIAGPKVAYDMFVSTLFGWGFLSWLSRERGWVSGRTGDWNRGVRGWIIWPGLAALLADCLINILGSVYAVSAYSGDSNKQKVNQRHNRGTDESEESHEAALEPSSSFWDQVMGLMRATIPSKAIGLGLVVITLLCPFLVNVAFGKTLVWVETFAAFVLALPLGYMAIQATGKTDTTPASALAKVSQFVFAFSSDLKHFSHSFLTNLVAGAIAEAGAVQAANLLLYQKLGQLLSVSAYVLFGAQILGSFLGCLFAVFWYWVFTSRASLQNGVDEALGLPAAHVWYATAKQALKRELPRSASTAAAVTGACFLLLAIVKFFSARQDWRFTRILCPRIRSEGSGRSSWIPNVDFVEREWLALFPTGSSFAIAMINTPHVTIAWSLGGLVCPILSYIGLDMMGILLIGSGLALGEGLAEILALLVNHWLPLTDKHVVCLVEC